jgi:hypothetical protein
VRKLPRHEVALDRVPVKQQEFLLYSAVVVCHTQNRNPVFEFLLQFIVLVNVEAFILSIEIVFVLRLILGGLTLVEVFGRLAGVLLHGIQNVLFVRLHFAISVHLFSLLFFSFFYFLLALLSSGF